MPYGQEEVVAHHFAIYAACLIDGFHYVASSVGGCQNAHLHFHAESIRPIYAQAHTYQRNAKQRARISPHVFIVEKCDNHASHQEVDDAGAHYRHQCHRYGEQRNIVPHAAARVLIYLFHSGYSIRCQCHREIGERLFQQHGGMAHEESEQ